MLMLELAKRLQALAPIRLTDGEALAMSQGLVEEYFIQRKRGLDMSFAPEVIADNSGKWAGNGLRFATREEAEANVKNLMWNWISVRETRVVESSDPVNYRWDAKVGLVSVLP